MNTINWKFIVVKMSLFFMVTLLQLIGFFMAYAAFKIAFEDPMYSVLTIVIGIPAQTLFLVLLDNKTAAEPGNQGDGGHTPADKS